MYLSLVVIVGVIKQGGTELIKLKRRKKNLMVLGFRGRQKNKNFQ